MANLTWMLIEKRTQIVIDRFYGTYADAEKEFKNKMNADRAIISMAKYHGF